MIDPLAEGLAAVFNRTFATSHRTVVCLGGNEPLYLPASTSQCAEIVCNRDFPASVLHEVAHWCLASAGRRRCIDYGYWYVPPPRDEAAQDRFLAAEARNQALESIFAAAAGLPFAVSLDDPHADPALRERFVARVRTQAAGLARTGLPARAVRFRRALEQEFNHG